MSSQFIMVTTENYGSYITGSIWCVIASMLSYDKHGWLVKKPSKNFEKYLNLLSSTCHIFLRCQASSSPEAVVRRCSVKKRVLRNFAKFTGKHLCQGLLFDKVYL